jgi:hypothetical protein
MLDRFIGEAVITFSDKSRQARRVLILSPYVQTSENLRDIDYDHSLVVDLQTMEFDFKSQLEEMIQNRELQSHTTFMSYAAKTVFRNGENVLQWLHRMKQISRVPATDVFIVVGQGGHQQKIPVVDINREIRAANEKKLAEQNQMSSTYTDPSLNEANIQPATIERSGNQYKQETKQVNESVEPEAMPVYESVEPPISQQNYQQPAGAVDLSKVPGVTILEGGEYVNHQVYASPNTDSQPASVGSVPETPAYPTQDNKHLEDRLEALEKLIKSRSKDTVITRLMQRYDLTEAEAVKALESAGKRKQKKAEKERQKAESGKAE